jgi:ATP-dependent RNA helicase SUPV3L1/SUV3
MTGQEQILIQNHSHVSCTIEKLDVSYNYEVALIDEIQLINDPFRGKAWTHALLGLKAEEIHLCGEPIALELIYKICKITGDDIYKVEHFRLGKLEVENDPITDIKDIKEGDCLIAFSKIDLLKLKNKISISKNNENVCGIIYGNLPPNTKKNQIKLFNNQSNSVKYLCATDAVIIF